jgi:hypothetical protein
MAYNEFDIKRTAYASIAIPNAATTVSTGKFIPAGAIVTGIRMVAPSAVTLTGASATVQLMVGAISVLATSNVSALGAQTVPSVKALATTAGNYLTVDSEISLIAQASSNSAATATYDVYVDYILV